MKQFKLLLLTLTSFISNAQVEKASPTTVSPTKIKVYTPSPSTNNTLTKDNSYRWVVKTNLASMIGGEFPIIAEYRIATKFSVEASAGITFAFFPNGNLISDEEYTPFETKAASGSAFRGTIKYYPSSDYDAIEGVYFGIQLFTKTTNRNYVADGYSYYTDYEDILKDAKDSQTKSGVSLVIGKQLFEDSNIAYGFFFGIGYANVTNEYYTEEYNETAQSYELVNMKTKESNPNFQLGLTVGFGN